MGAGIHRQRRLLASVAFMGKGGSGKSTTCNNIAVVAASAGLRVAIVDADPQQSAFAWRGRRGTNDIAVARYRLEHLEDATERARLAGIDVLLIDMPPDLRRSVAAAHYADLVLVPMRPTLFDAVVTSGIIAKLSSARIPHGVLINAAPTKRVGCEAPMVREARQAFADVERRLWKGQITHRLEVPRATVRGEGILETEPAGSASDEYRLLWSSICSLPMFKEKLNGQSPPHSR